MLRRLHRTVQIKRHFKDFTLWVSDLHENYTSCFCMCWMKSLICDENNSAKAFGVMDDFS